MSNSDFDAIDFFRAGPLFQNPYPYYEYLREHGPVWREYIRDYARPFTLLVVADLLGVPESEHETFREELEGNKRPNAAVDHKPLEFLYQRFTNYIEERRREPRDDADDVQELVDLAVARFGGLHVMFNNAGISGSMHGRFLDDDLKDFERVMAVNLFGVMVGSQRAARHMEKNGGGSIINTTTSIAALKPGGGVMTYRASKAGVIQFSKSIAIELAEHEIRVNCIAPGLIATGITSYDMAPVIRRMQPLPRRGMPVDVANAALYLASERSAQVTGMVLPVDGGTSVGAPAKPVKEVTSARAPATE